MDGTRRGATTSDERGPGINGVNRYTIQHCNMHGPQINTFCVVTRKNICGVLNEEAQMNVDG